MNLVLYCVTTNKPPDMRRLLSWSVRNCVNAEPKDAEFRTRLLELIPHLRAFAHTLCQSRDAADDLAQEAIANAWQARSSFQPGTNLKAWLFVIQRNAFYTDYRRKWRQVCWDQTAMDRILVTGPPQHGSVELTDLRRAMGLLPDQQREALILVGAGGFSHREAAAICGCAVGTMKSRVARARLALVSSMRGGRLPQPTENTVSAYQSIVRELKILSGGGRRSRRRSTPAAETAL